MAAMLETPSRVWRRIQDREAQDLPSLPSLPAFEDSQEPQTETETSDDEDIILHQDTSSPFQSTPAPSSAHHTMATIRPPSTGGSTSRFARSIVSRSSRSSLGSSGTNTARQQSLAPEGLSFNDISAIPGLPETREDNDFLDIRSSDQEMEESVEHPAPDAYVSPDVVDDDGDDDLDISDALASVSRAGSPAPGLGTTPKKKYDYSVSLKSEPRVSPFDKLRNVSIRKPLPRPPSRTRTPSLTHTLSPPSSVTSSTPHSTRSFRYDRSQPQSPLAALAIPLPRSATASPTAGFLPRTQRQPFQEAATDEETEETDGHGHSQDMSMATDQELGGVQPSEQEEQSVQRHSETQDEREPTFSSEGDPRSSSRDSSRPNGTPGSRHSLLPSPGQLGVAFAPSPTPSIAFTPTPAFQPRPRAPRFIVMPQSTTPEDSPEDTREREGEEGEDEGSTWRPEQHNQLAGREGTQVPQTPVPATPYTHKRSFLLSVINSTARPRPRFLPTPHPTRTNNLDQTPAPITESAEEEEEEEAAEAESQSSTVVPATPGLALRTPFAGVTPRPRGPVRRRLSNPITTSQPWAARTVSTTSVTASGTGTTSRYTTQSPSTANPDHLDDRASMISTTSSQDLTTHARANASFDPIIGLGERGGHGVGRFNAGKLNSYLHGLNRKLQEENEALVERLRDYEEKYGIGLEGEKGSERMGSASPTSASAAAATSLPAIREGRRTSGGGRRISEGPLGLNDVAEEAEDAWGEEKAALEEMIDELKEELERCTADKEEAEKQLETERGERSRDKERWRDRMGEVERGVEGIVRELESKQREAEQRAKVAESEKALAVKGLERQLSEVVAERDVLVERVEQAEVSLEGGKGLGAELNAANERVGKLMSELKSANAHTSELEEDMTRLDGRIGTLEKELREEKRHSAELREELDASRQKASQSLQRIATVENEFTIVRNELAESQQYIAQLEEDGHAVVHRVESLEEELAQSEEKVEALTGELEQERERATHLEEEAERAGELARQMEEALEAAETKIQNDDVQVVSLKAKLSALERELDKSQTTEPGVTSDVQADIESLENELADANKEIARLTTLLSQSPARRAIEKAKDAKIEVLEREREDLQERLKVMRSSTNSTPHKLFGGTTMSPMHRQILAMSLKSPKTPGGPLKDLSWLQSTMHDPTAAPLIAEIERLQQELDRANESIDEKLDRLEDAGMGVVTLTNQLEDAKTKIVSLENEIGRVSRREERRLRRLEKLRCQKCQVKVDLNGLATNLADESSFIEPASLYLPSEPPTPPTKTSERLRVDLLSVNKKLVAMQQQWEEERHKLAGENAVLQDTTKRLNAEVRSAKSELQRYVETEKAGERGKAVVQAELDAAKSAVDELESELKKERTRLRELTTEQSKAERQKEKVVLQLRRTESDMADVKEHLSKIKQENHTLEAELRTNVNIEQKARHLERKVAENAQTIEQLRQERSLLVADHKKLQSRYTEASDHVNKLRAEHATSQTSHDTRRHQLDIQVLEIEDLRRALSQQTTELQKASEENQRIRSEKSDVARSVASLEADLARVKRSAEAFGRDLKMLREQKEKLEKEKEEEVVKAERAHKQMTAQIRILKEELQSQKTKVKDGEERWKAHICAASGDSSEVLTALKLQHKNECKGLIVQIRYLKAKFTRESTLRNDLGYQKRYLLALLARCERTETKILAVIAAIGYPPTEPPSLPSTRRRTLKSVAFSIIFLHRATRASESWREQCSSKDAITEALQEVRRRRVANVPAPSGSGSGSSGSAAALSQPIAGSSKDRM